MTISRRSVLLLVAAVIAAFTAISVRNRLTQVPAVEAPMAATRIVVAKHDLSLGSFVQGAQDLDWGPAPEPVSIPTPQPNESSQTEGIAPAATPTPTPNAPKETYLYEGAVKLTDFNGAVVRRSVRAGDPVPQSALMKSGEGGFMSAVLEGGKRAVSIAVTATSGNAGFVSPGDHVDLIVTHRVKTTEAGNIADEVVVSETFTHDVRVVAVDQMLDNPENKAILAKTITVEVSPRQAEQIAVAAEMGKISIALRSIADAETNKTDTQTAPKTDAENDGDKNAHALADLYGSDVHENAEVNNNDVTQLIGHKGPIVPRVTVIHGDKSENIDFYQGKQ